MKKIIWILGILWSALSTAQLEPVTWQSSIESLGEARYRLHFKAEIAPKWHLYSQYSNPEGAIPTEFKFSQEGEGYERIGSVEESESALEYDTVFEMDLTFFNGSAQFYQDITLTDLTLPFISVEIEYQACDDELCIFRTEPITFMLSEEAEWAAPVVDDRSQQLSKALLLELKGTELLASSTSSSESNALLQLFFLGFLGGLLALLTPCVFPMIPLTVSFFLKQATSSSRGISNALLYTFFIILIYVGLSTPFHFLDELNPEILNNLATNVVLNVVFFVVFVVFALSFFGYFELTLPSGWGNSTDEASRSTGVIGIFFMALTLAIVSFSCTGPILGSLLAGSLGVEGGATQLTVGMLGFGVALGLPFGLFALFPNTLKALPKSGGWMTTVKVVLGFLELALALKFLSNADLVGHWGLLKREIFLALWAILSIALTLYLFGVYRFPHETKTPLSTARKAFAGLALLGSVYLLFGLFSEKNQLRFLSGFPPPEFYSIFEQDLDCPLGLDCYNDFETGKQAALASGKPILLDFTGWACVNCRRMEENVWADPSVYPLLRDEYVLNSLYVDDREPLLDSEAFSFQYAEGKVKSIRTVGNKWATFQALNFNTASQPFYVQLTADGQLLTTPIQYTDTATFRDWLTKGLENVPPAAPKVNYIIF
ncbi:MAG: protein-disulfide reductase DsbD family protein [Flavobacteriaceae bacterium]